LEGVVVNNPALAALVELARNGWPRGPGSQYEYQDGWCISYAAGVDETAIRRNGGGWEVVKGNRWAEARKCTSYEEAYEVLFEEDV
jgi:hypothetical protein